MPKIVDHEARRVAIIEATWRLIEKDGIEKTTMRAIANEVGLANGALVVYFPNKRAILIASLERAFQQTNERYRRALDGRRGLEALRLFFLEMLPIDAVRLTEARVVLAFWELAAVDPELSDINRTVSSEWRAEVAHLLGQAVERGEVRENINVQAVIDLMFTIINGAQVSGVLRTLESSVSRQLASLDVFFESISA